MMNFNEIVSVIADHNKRFQETVESLEQDKGRKLTINEIDRLTVDPDTTEYE